MKNINNYIDSLSAKYFVTDNDILFIEIVFCIILTIIILLPGILFMVSLISERLRTYRYNVEYSRARQTENGNVLRCMKIDSKLVIFVDNSTTALSTYFKKPDGFTYGHFRFDEGCMRVPAYFKENVQDIDSIEKVNLRLNTDVRCLRETPHSFTMCSLFIYTPFRSRLFVSENTTVTLKGIQVFNVEVESLTTSPQI